MENKEEKKLNLIREFRMQLVSFLDELIEQFPEEGEFVIIRIFVKDQMPMADVLGRYIRDLLPFSNQIKDRNENFFLENDLLYTGTSIGASRINHFRNLWQSDKLDQNDRETVWKWMELFNAIASRYLKNFGYVQGWEPKK